MADQAKAADAAPAQDGEAGAQPAAGGVNSQIMDAVSAVDALAAGIAPASSAAMLGLATSQSVALGMYNAIARQQADATIASAALAAVCARIMGTPPPAGAAAASAAGLIAMAEAQAQAGILILRSQRAQADGDPDSARAALARVAAAAAAADGKGDAPAGAGAGAKAKPGKGR
jgi:hypothetical protein